MRTTDEWMAETMQPILDRIAGGEMSKHTPGPWSISTVPTSMGTCHKIGPFPSNGAYAETHACVYADNVREHDYGHSKTGDELLANARLIAAAPDLLEALESVLDALGALGNRNELNNRLSTNECKQVWAAYDKAKGETK